MVEWVNWTVRHWIHGTARHWDRGQGCKYEQYWEQKNLGNAKYYQIIFFRISSGRHKIVDCLYIHTCVTLRPNPWNQKHWGMETIV